MRARSGMYLMALALLAALAGGCERELAAPVDEFAGTWRWVVSEGGIAGRQYDPTSVGFTVTLEFDLNGTVRGFRDDDLVATASYTALQRLSLSTTGPEWEVTYDPPLSGVFDFTSLDEHTVQFLNKGVVRFTEPCCDRYVHVFTELYVR